MENKIVDGLSNQIAAVFIDDTVVYAVNEREFLSNLRSIFDRLRYHNVKLKPSKYHFGCASVEFVGHIFDQDGYHLSDERKRGIIDMVRPKTLKQLRSFLGMLNFLGNSFLNYLTFLYL